MKKSIKKCALTVTLLSLYITFTVASMYSDSLILQFLSDWDALSNTFTLCIRYKEKYLTVK